MMIPKHRLLTLVRFYIELPFITKLLIYYFRKDTKLMTKSIIVELKVIIFLLKLIIESFAIIIGPPLSQTVCHCMV